MQVSNLVGQLKTVVVGIAVIIQLQNMVICRHPSVWVNELIPKRLAGAVAWQSADRASIEVAPIDQIAPRSTDKGNTDRRLARH